MLFCNVHLVDILGSIDDKIELNEEIQKKFNTFLNLEYRKYCEHIINKKPLSSLIKKQGVKLNNEEWKSQSVVDLSTMSRENIVINNFSSGDNFTTNIQSLEEGSLLYGSIRPYFKKCGFTTGINFVAGTVFSFKPVKEKYFLWLLAVISSNDFHEVCNKKSQGTKMPVITWKAFCDYQVLMPSDKNIEGFNKTMEPFLNKIKQSMLENRKLQQLKTQYLKNFFS